LSGKHFSKKGQFANVIIGHLHGLKKRLATGLLMVFVAVIIGDLLCAVEFIDSRIYSGISGKLVKDHAHESGHDHFQKVENNESHHDLAAHHDAAENDHDETDEEECCKEETNQLFASLLKHKVPKFYAAAIQRFYQIQKFEYKNPIISTKSDNPYWLKSALSPPKGSFIRILLQSFTC
jgi:hypothetical protein